MPGSNSALSRNRPSQAGRGLAHLAEQPATWVWVMAALLVLAVGWVAMARVDRVVRVDGRIVPAGRSQSIQHLEGGIVAAIMAQEGAVVRKGDVLLAISDTMAQANLSETQVKLDGLKVKAVRLAAEAEGATAMNVPAALRQNQEFVETETRLFAARRQKMEQERRIFDEQIRQRNAELREVEARKANLVRELETARERVKLMTGMASRNAASHLEVLEAQSRLQRLLTELSDAENLQPKIHAAIAESHARIQDVGARYRADAQGELSGTRVEIDRLENLMTSQTDRFTRTEVRAPVDGTVNRITTNTVGGVVKPGDTLIEITPSAAELLIEAKARPSDRGDLRTQLPAKIRISAYDAAEFGTLSGRVVEVSADTVADSKGEPFYRVVIQVDAPPQSYTGKLIVPGMTISGDVVIGSRTVLQYVTSPFTKFAFNAFRDAR